MIILEFLFVFLMGAIGYGSIETLWRGYTHWTMLLLGGLCLYSIYLIAGRMKEAFWKKILLCTAVVTSLEFAAGCVINIRLGWDVWDYSDSFLNLMGQICPLFSLMWMLLSIPCLIVCRVIYRFIFMENLKK